MRVGWIGKESSKTNVDIRDFDLNNSKSSETCRTVARNKCYSGYIRHCWYIAQIFSETSSVLSPQVLCVLLPAAQIITDLWDYPILLSKWYSIV